jgi:hypothetical protein
LTFIAFSIDFAFERCSTGLLQLLLCTLAFILRIVPKFLKFLLIVECLKFATVFAFSAGAASAHV